MAEQETAEPVSYDFTSKELVAALIKAKGIKEGHWALTARFNLSLVSFAQDPTGVDAAPSGVVSLVGAGIEEVPAGVPFAVDAARI